MQYLDSGTKCEDRTTVDSSKWLVSPAKGSSVIAPRQNKERAMGQTFWSKAPSVVDSQGWVTSLVDKPGINSCGESVGTNDKRCPSWNPNSLDWPKFPLVLGLGF